MIITILITIIGVGLIAAFSFIFSYFIKKNNQKKNSDMPIFSGKLENTDVSIDNIINYLKCTDSLIQYMPGDKKDVL